MKEQYQFYFKNSLKEYSINIYTHNKRNCLIFKYKNTNAEEKNNNVMRIGGFSTPAVNKGI